MRKPSVGRIKGRLKLKVYYRNQTLHVLIQFIENLAMNDARVRQFIENLTMINARVSQFIQFIIKLAMNNSLVSQFMNNSPVSQIIENLTMNNAHCTGKSAHRKPCNE